MRVQQGGCHSLNKYLWRAGQGSRNSCWRFVEWLLHTCMCVRNSRSPALAAGGFVPTGGCDGGAALAPSRQARAGGREGALLSARLVSDRDLSLLCG